MKYLNDTTTIPTRVLRDARMSSSDALVYGLLVSNPEITTEDIADILSSKPSTIRASIRVLKKCGYITAKTILVG